MAQAWYSTISINSAQVPSTQTDFPVLVSQTDARFKTIANSGHVANANGYDIRPYTDTTLGTAITGYELERYNASTGEVIMWVKVSSLSSSTTPIVLGYGDSSLTTDGSSTTTWSNSFLGVYHMKDGTTLSVADATGVNNGTAQGPPTATTGKIDGAGAFVAASSQAIGITTSVINPTAITLSAWINATSFPQSYQCVLGRNTSNSSYSVLLIKSTGKLAPLSMATGAVGYDGSGSNTLSSGTTYLVAMTYSSSTGMIGYVNGAQDGTSAANGNLNTTNTSSAIARDLGNAGRLWNGMIDEARISSVARSADWLATEYNNQNAPATFETLGTEVSVGTSTGNMFLLFP